MPDPIERLNAALEGRYQIDREVGEGGMATVYLADDLRHERKVALKVLKPELAAVVGADRFLAEIKTTANLQHPHILPLFDSGEADGFLFYVMPYVEGETLREKLDRDHQLPVDDAVKIAKNVAEAPRPPSRRGGPGARPAPSLGQSATRVATAWMLAAVLTGAADASAQRSDGAAPPAGSVSIDGSPPPVPPESITRDGLGRATVRAIRLRESLVLDGSLDEDVYSDIQPFGNFVQVTPTAGAPSSERTDVWVSYDDSNVYVTCRCWDSAPPEDWVANELRRDTPGLRNNDHFGVMFDTFYDRRSGFMFYANPLGARADYSVVDEGRPNADWNPVWDVAEGRFEGGWIVEMAIPFKSLRYRSGPDRIWGIQLRRSIRHKNEWTYLNPVPPFMAGPQAFGRVSAAGTVVDLDLPPAGSNLELKPYAITDLTTDRVSSPASSNVVDADIGIDLKYGITANLTADLTVNTDFAQVEVDEQQVNLTRFSLFFPEKRDFFLEGRGMFEFGQGGVSGFRPRAGVGRGFNRGGGDAPSLFYTRRIGLDRGQVIPIEAGGRVTGKVGDYAIGAMNVQTGADEGAAIAGTNYSVIRVKRDILRRSSIGALFTNRSVAVSGEGANRAYGADAAFAFFTNLELGGYYARTETRSLDGDDESYQAAVDYAGDLYGASATHLKVGDDFNPEVGFLRRRDVTKSSGTLRYSPRLASIDWVRKLTWEASLDYFENGAGEMESRKQQGRFDVELENSDRFTVEAIREFELIVEPFPVGADVEIGPGPYTFTSYRASYQLGPQRRASGTVSFQWGDFYDGTIRAIAVDQGRVVVSNHLSLEPGVSLNLLDLPVGESNQTVLRLRSDYAFTPRMFASALVQYNSADRTVSSNLRFRWEYSPGSELLLVWTDERDSRRGGNGLRNRALAFKITRLLRY